MKLLDLKPTHKAITAYYTELQQLAQVKTDREGAVSPAFANLLRHCAKQFNWTLYERYSLKHGFLIITKSVPTSRNISPTCSSA
jgi:hypothetical protein